MATCYQYHGAWYIQYSVNGKRKKENIGRCSSISAVEARLRAKAKEIELATGKSVFSSVPVLSQFIPQYLEWYEKEYPTSFYRVEQIIKQHLEPEFGLLPMDTIRTGIVEKYKSKRRDDVKTATVIKEIRTLKAMLNRAFYLEIIPAMPFRRIEEPQILDSKPPRFYAKEELQQIYLSSTSLHAAIWKLYGNTGMRRTEGLILRRQWIGQEGMKILSTDEERTKSGKWRDIPLTEGAKESLEIIPKDGIYVLPRIHPSSLSRAFINDAQKAGLDGGIHTLRHTYISHLVMAGTPLRAVQILAGHASIKTTEKYAHLAPGYLQNMGGTAINL